MEQDTSKSLRRAFAILDCFSYDTPELGVRQIARKINFSPSTTGRLLQAMKHLGVLRQNPMTHSYSLGAKVLYWAGVYSAGLDVRQKALPVMLELQRLTMETISLYVLEGDERVCVERLESPQSVRIIARIGRRLPLYAGSAGKVFLAFLPVERRDQILHRTQLVPLTPSTIVDPAVLQMEIEKIRRQGYGVSHGEWIADAAGVSAPVFDAGGEIAAALTISGPIQRFTQENVSKYVSLVVEGAKKISFELGYQSEAQASVLQKVG
ncbi:MAG: IclR family transcriptional regulator [Anaerolineae bacterium]|nr:IclR family transcriptional regulator [Anaerolineae bacterium]